MNYNYNVLNEVYFWILSGMKTIEVRLLKEKSKKIQVNDFITFNNQDCEGKYIKVKVLNKNIYNNINNFLDNNEVNKILPNHTEEELIELLTKIYGDNLINGKIVAFEFEVIDTDLDIEIDIYKEPYIKKLTDDKIINLTGQSGSGKSTYACHYFSSEKYEIIDTDDVFNEKRFNNATGLNKKLGEYFRNKYKKIPDLGNNFDLIYNEIINYCKNIDKTIIIDCAQFHCIKDISLLKGKVIVIRTNIDTCYNRTISRWINNYEQNGRNYTEEELNKYKERKKSIYKWYKYSNEFIRKLECL